MEFCAVLRKYPKDTPGGAEYQAYLISRELAKRGHDVHYVAYQAGQTKTEIDEGIQVHRMDSASTKEVIGKLASIQSDVYYFRLVTDLPLLWRAKRQLNGEFVYNISRDVQCKSLFDRGPPHDSFNLFRSFLSRGRYAFYRFLLRVPDKIFAQTHHQQELLKENHSLESTVIGNGHPIPDGNIQKASPPAVLWLSSLKRVKNPELFLRLFERTRDLPVQFWIVGRPVDSDVREMVQEKADECEKITYLGGTGIVESNEYFKKASVYVHTGNSEGFPNTMIQSWLHRTPVISLGANPDLVLERHDIGEYCSSIDEAEIQLRQLTEDKKFRKSIGTNARRYAINNHSIEKIVDKIERSLRV